MLRSSKHQALVDDPVIRYKPIESLPGITPVFGRRLRDRGFDTADKVLQQYLRLNRNESRFTFWMNTTCGANSHCATQCFNGLNEWYHTWGKEASIPKIKKACSPSSIQNPLNNRMLLEQKILQLNFNSSNLAKYQAMSMVDISRPQRALHDNLNKSHSNIPRDFQYSLRGKSADYDRCHSLASLVSSTQKSVNFKENEIIDDQTPRRFKGPTSPRRTISPILKPRSLTPENKISEYYQAKKSSLKSLNIQMEPKNSPYKINGLNSKYHTFTKKNPNKPTVKPKELECTCNNNSNISNLHSVLPNDHLTSQIIEKYFDEARKIQERPRMPTPTSEGRQGSRSPVSISSCDFANENGTFNFLSTTESEAESIETPIESSLTESEAVTPTSSVDITDATQLNWQCSKEYQSEESYFDNSNEDSGLDLNTTNIVGLSNTPEVSEDESATLFENTDSLSGSDTDRTYEVNETTDVESVSCNEGSKVLEKDNKDNEHDQSENDLDSSDETKRSNVRLFCDMLSSDLEQLPSDRFRRLKLRILQLVYAELDECGSKNLVTKVTK